MEWRDIDLSSRRLHLRQQVRHGSLRPVIHKSSSASLSLQAGAFLSRPNADKVKTRLIENGFEADVLTLKDTKGRDWYLVRSGSYPSSDEAKKGAAALKEKLGIESAIRPSGDW